MSALVCGARRGTRVPREMRAHGLSHSTAPRETRPIDDSHPTGLA